MSGVIFANPASGPDDTGSPDELEAAFRGSGVQVRALTDPARLPGLVRDALGASMSPIGVAGGDGTVRCVAEILAGTDVPMLVVPAGTRNHFARELGIETVEDAVHAAREGHIRRVSVGRVGGRGFVNNASIGLYPALVRRRESSEGRLPKAVAALVAAFSVARRAGPVAVSISGEELTAWLVFVGNGRYGEGFTDLVERDSLDAGVLDVRVLRAGPRLARARVVLALLSGRLRSSPLIFSAEATDLSIGLEGRAVDVALDGEVVRLTAPLRFTVEPSALQVLAAEPA